ncbi:MAG: hypothetical protein AAGF12_01165 [Myxococcota bacterium]
MAWKIHSWSEKTGKGTIASPHFGPWPFGPTENPMGTTDFRIGEEVSVHLEPHGDTYVVASVILTRQRQPQGTEWKTLQELGASHASDLEYTVVGDHELVLRLFDCCAWCSDVWTIRFRGVTTHTLPCSDDSDLDNPLLRFASSTELDEHRIAVPENAEAYCVVTRHGLGLDGPRYFIVARSVEVTLQKCGTDPDQQTLVYRSAEPTHS